MASLEQDIISLFRSNPKEFSAEDVAMRVLSEKYAVLEIELNDEYTGRERKEEIELELLNIRKRILYYLKKLEQEGIIALSKRAYRGKKYYSWNLQSGQKIQFLGKKKIIVESQGNYAQNTRVPDEESRYESEGLVAKYKKSSFGRYVDAYMIQCNNVDENRLVRILEHAKANNAIAFYNPALELLSPRILKILKSMSANSGVGYSAVFDIQKGEYNITSFRETLSVCIDNSIIPIIIASPNDIISKTERPFIESAVRLAMEKNSIIYVQNSDVKKSPMFLGSAGVYSFSDKGYEEASAKKDAYALACAQNSVLIDVARFLQNYSIRTLRDAIIQSANQLFKANLLLKDDSLNNYSDDIVGEEFLSLSRDYIRFWNYGLKQPGVEQENVMLMLKSARETLKGYSNAQETIYKTCGMPLRFKLAFSVIFIDEIPPTFSKLLWKRGIVSSLSDIIAKGPGEVLKLKEEASAIFNGGDRTRLIRKSGVETDEILKELSFILKTFSIVLWCIDFSSKSKEITLNNFFR